MVRWWIFFTEGESCTNAYYTNERTVKADVQALQNIRTVLTKKNNPGCQERNWGKKKY